MSEPIQNNAIKNLQNIQKMRSESMQEYHKKVDEQARIREQEKIKTHNIYRSKFAS